jgi:hypothetical protein
MSGSSLLVVLNALRLQGGRSGRGSRAAEGSLAPA